MTLKPPCDRLELEKDIEDYCVDYVEDLGWEHIKLDRIIKGWPDQLFFAPEGGILMVEFKRQGEEIRPKQAAVHRRFQALGHKVHVVQRRKHFRRLVASVGCQETPEPE